MSTLLDALGPRRDDCVALAGSPGCTLCLGKRDALILVKVKQTPLAAASQIWLQLRSFGLSK